MPKKRVTKKTTKTGLSRGRVPKHNTQEDAGSASETEDNSSEPTVSTKESNDVETDRSQSPPPVKKSKKGSVSVTAGGSNHHDHIEDVDTTGWKSWEDLPDLIEDLKVEKGNLDGTIKYITKLPRHRKFELDARKALFHKYFELEELKSTCHTSLKLMRNLHPSLHNGKVSDAIRALGVPRSFGELVLKLMSLPAPNNLAPAINIDAPILEESEEEMEMEAAGVPFAGSNRNFPSPAKMAKYATPKNQRIFEFGIGTHSKGLSTNKAPRLAKPGEVMFSQSGSPIMQRRIIDNKTAQTLERVEVLQPDGTKMEVEMVYRGVPNAGKIREFKEFAKDVRGIAASRATSVRQNRVQAPRINLGSQSAVSNAKKPGWR